MAEWFSGDMTANGITIHYYRTGGDKPPLVLCHGATDDGLCWTRVARALEADYDVIMPDARGHGLSAALESGYTPTEQAANLAGLLEALRLYKPAVGGHSMGASTTFFLAATYPDLPRCVILEDPPFWSPGAQMSDEERQARGARMRAEAAAQRAMSREALLAHIGTLRPTWSAEEYGPWADSKMRLSANFSTAPRPAAGPDWLEALPKITCPALLITADPEEGAIVTPEAAQEAVRRLPSLQVVRLHGAGHNIRREQFDGFLQAVRAFLATA
jgi:pimeloyl-ACP methyl ester carboxylesterase